MDKILQEGHWIGLEVIPLTQNIAMANNIPLNVEGVLIDEVTLLAAESGLLAGDVITAIGGENIADLKSFQNATKKTADALTANVTVYRLGNEIVIAVQSAEVLGMAQMEAAPMILATDRSPHGYYGPCDRCHTIAETNKNIAHLKKDAGDILATQAPTIIWGATAPHRDRGLCISCHKIKI
ncbi:magnetosome protein MamP [Candidatus Magnetoovum chiemensis]|nr:magnetosome protein MamP [Candidatus Magnetoovum chiemensis]